MTNQIKTYFFHPITSNRSAKRKQNYVYDYNRTVDTAEKGHKGKIGIQRRKSGRKMIVNNLLMIINLISQFFFFSFLFSFPSITQYRLSATSSWHQSVLYTFYLHLDELRRKKARYRKKVGNDKKSEK